MKINYDSEVCQHAGVCVQTLPNVYMIKDGQFVIDSTAATDEELKMSIAQCPSGALSSSNEG
jgi:uncharacterized Fe-S cluster protein YjdI